MTTPRPQRATSLAAIVGALLVLLLGLPAVISLTSGGGAVCFSTSTCPLSSLNPCVRKPSFAVVGRCAVAFDDDVPAE